MNHALHLKLSGAGATLNKVLLILTVLVHGACIIVASYDSARGQELVDAKTQLGLLCT